MSDGVSGCGSGGRRMCSKNCQRDGVPARGMAPGARFEPSVITLLRVSLGCSSRLIEGLKGLSCTFSSWPPGRQFQVRLIHFTGLAGSSQLSNRLREHVRGIRVIGFVFKCLPKSGLRSFVVLPFEVRIPDVEILGKLTFGLGRL